MAMSVGGGNFNIGAMVNNVVDGLFGKNNPIGDVLGDAAGAIANFYTGNTFGAIGQAMGAFQKILGGGAGAQQGQFNPMMMPMGAMNRMMPPQMGMPQQMGGMNPAAMGGGYPVGGGAMGNMIGAGSANSIQGLENSVNALKQKAMSGKLSKKEELMLQEQSQKLTRLMNLLTEMLSHSHKTAMASIRQIAT
jgi:hypothetical protein